MHADVSFAELSLEICRTQWTCLWLICPLASYAMKSNCVVPRLLLTRALIDECPSHKEHALRWSHDSHMIIIRNKPHQIELLWEESNRVDGHSRWVIIKVFLRSPYTAIHHWPYQPLTGDIFLLWELAPALSCSPVALIFMTAVKSPMSLLQWSHVSDSLPQWRVKIAQRSHKDHMRTAQTKGDKNR